MGRFFGFLDTLSTEAQINRYLREESPQLLSLLKQEDFGDFAKFKISENLCFSTYKIIKLLQKRFY
jgi:hypothetical protein